MSCPTTLKDLSIPEDYSDFTDLSYSQRRRLIDAFFRTKSNSTANFIWKCCGSQSKNHVDRGDHWIASGCKYIRNHGEPIDPYDRHPKRTSATATKKATDPPSKKISTTTTESTPKKIRSDPIRTPIEPYQIQPCSSTTLPSTFGTIQSSPKSPPTSINPPTPTIAPSVWIVDDDDDIKVELAQKPIPLGQREWILKNSKPIYLVKNEVDPTTQKKDSIIQQDILLSTAIPYPSVPVVPETSYRTEELTAHPSTGQESMKYKARLEEETVANLIPHKRALPDDYEVNLGLEQSRLIIQEKEYILKYSIEILKQREQLLQDKIKYNSQCMAAQKRTRYE